MFQSTNCHFSVEVFPQIAQRLSRDLNKIKGLRKLTNSPGHRYRWINSSPWAGGRHCQRDIREAFVWTSAFFYLKFYCNEIKVTAIWNELYRICKHFKIQQVAGLQAADCTEGFINLNFGYRNCSDILPHIFGPVRLITSQFMAKYDNREDQQISPFCHWGMTHGLVRKKVL